MLRRLFVRKWKTKCIARLFCYINFVLILKWFFNHHSEINHLHPIVVTHQLSSQTLLQLSLDLQHQIAASLRATRKTGLLLRNLIRATCKSFVGCRKIESTPFRVETPLFETKSHSLTFLLFERNHCDQSNTLQEFINELLGIFEANVVVFSKCSNRSSDSRRLMWIVKNSTTMDELMQNINTPYIFIPRGMSSIKNKKEFIQNLFRQFHVLLSHTADIVSGATRSDKLLWHFGCYQISVRVYTLQIRFGYDFTTLDGCSYCEYVDGPILMKRSSLTELSLQLKQFDDEWFVSLFLTLQSMGEIVLGCPDVMFDSDDNLMSCINVNQRQAWISVASDNNLNKIIMPNGASFTFSCAETSSECSVDIVQDKSRFIPPCCYHQLLLEYNAFQSYMASFKVHPSLTGGSVIAAVKSLAYLPWDKDIDLYVYTTAELFDKMFQRIGKGFQSWGFRDFYRFRFDSNYSSDKPAKLHSTAAGQQYIEVQWMGEKINSDFPTLIRFGDRWDLAWENNPGLAIRGMYGTDVLKHCFVSSGMMENRAQCRINYEYDYQCNVGVHYHNCLGIYPKDGSIPFEVLTGSFTYGFVPRVM